MIQWFWFNRLSEWFSDSLIKTSLITTYLHNNAERVNEKSPPVELTDKWSDTNTVVELYTHYIIYNAAQPNKFEDWNLLLYKKCLFCNAFNFMYWATLLSEMFYLSTAKAKIERFISALLKLFMIKFPPPLIQFKRSYKQAKFGPFTISFPLSVTLFNNEVVQCTTDWNKW